MLPVCQYDQSSVCLCDDVSVQSCVVLLSAASALPFLFPACCTFAGRLLCKPTASCQLVNQAGLQQHQQRCSEQGISPCSVPAGSCRRHAGPAAAQLPRHAAPAEQALFWLHGGGRLFAAAQKALVATHCVAHGVADLKVI